jgi:hypothetical protein
MGARLLPDKESDFSIKMLNAFLIYPAQLILPELLTLIIFSVVTTNYESLIMQLSPHRYSPHEALGVISLEDILNLCSSPRVKEQVLHLTYKNRKNHSLVFGLL